MNAAAVMMVVVVTEPNTGCGGGDFAMEEGLGRRGGGILRLNRGLGSLVLFEVWNDTILHRTCWASCRNTYRP